MSKCKIKEEFIMIIKHNLNAMNAIRNMNLNTTSNQVSMQRLSSGLRVNSAKDDAAGLAISEKMRAQIRGLNQASRNSQDGISLAQTAEGTLNEVHSMLQRMRELAVQAANDTNDKTNKEKLNEEYSKLTDEIATICAQAKFNGQELFSTTAKATNDGFKFQVGANEGESCIVKWDAVTIEKLELDKNAPDILEDHAEASITGIDKAIEYVSKIRSTLGAYQNRFEYRINADNTTAENLQAAESRIRDTDMAEEMTNFTQSNILTQAAQAMLAQANQQPQNVLSLLR